MKPSSHFVKIVEWSDDDQWADSCLKRHRRELWCALEFKDLIPGLLM